MTLTEITGAVTLFVRQHEGWGVPIVFALSFGESLAFLSLLLPATVILFGVGALIGESGIAFWPLWLSAALGAALGDWLSFWIGLRYTSVNQFQIFRTALSDVELGGELIREGETVTVALPAANRDPARFGCPDRLDLSQDASAQLAFGYGVHACVGQRLARLVLAEALTTLVLGLPELGLAVPLREVPVRLKTPVLSVLRLPVRF